MQIGHHCFTFDNVFGSSATPLNAIFDKCVKSLVEGLFQGYNATVLAYGQVCLSVISCLCLVVYACHLYSALYLSLVSVILAGGSDITRTTRKVLKDCITWGSSRDS